MGKPITIYWANDVFYQATRLWNRTCAKILEKNFGYQVTLPQNEALKFVDESGQMDNDALAKDCARQVLQHDVAIIILDGADTDSGTAFEAGVKYQSGGITIGVRTDIRNHESKCGNAMFLNLTEVVYYSCLESEDPQKLCQKIHEAIQRHIKQ